MNIPSLLAVFAALLIIVPSPIRADDTKSIRVFVALCDNKTQGIIPVGAKIGDGDKPDDNLYWGCSDGFPKVFGRSKLWKTESTEKDLSPVILRRMTLRHTSGNLRIVADAYRGSAMKECLTAFEAAMGSGEHDLVAFIGHNGLMDFRLPENTALPTKGTDAIVLCCMSAGYFTPRLEQLKARPVLLTRQLMYPGSFLLHDAIEAWRTGKTRPEIRAAAARAYAKNQKISVKAAIGIFAPLD